MKSQAMTALTFAATAALLAGCGSDSATTAGAPPPVAQLTETAPSPTASSSASPSASASPSTSADFVWGTSTLLIDDWIVNWEEVGLSGFNWRTQESWLSDPILSSDELDVYDGAAELNYEQLDLLTFTQQDGLIWVAAPAISKGDELNADERYTMISRFDPTNGDLIGSCNFNETELSLVPAPQGPAILTTEVNGYVTSADELLHLNEDCQTVWRVPLGAALIEWPGSGTTAVGGFGGGGGNYSTSVNLSDYGGFDINTGASLWQSRDLAGGFAGLDPKLLEVLPDRILVAPGGTEQFQWLDINTGAPLSRPIDASRTASCEATADEATLVLYALCDGTLTAYDSSSNEIWTRSGITAGAAIELACFDRLWISEGNTDYLVDGRTGDTIGEQATPSHCLDAESGIYWVGDTGRATVKPLPKLA